MPFENENLTTRTPTRTKQQPIRKGLMGTGGNVALIPPPVVPGLMTQAQIAQAQASAQANNTNYIENPSQSYSPPGFTVPSIPLSGSFMSGAGRVNTGGQWGAPPPSGSFLSGAGQVNTGGQTNNIPVMATPPPVYADLPLGRRPNDRTNELSALPQFPTGTFFGAGGEAVRGPDSPIAMIPPGGGGGFATRYKKMGGRGGGGYGDYGGYGGRDYYPSWLMGLYSWNFKG